MQHTRRQRSAEDERQVNEYPWIDLQTPGLETLSAEPPVYLIRDFLSSGDCDNLVCLTPCWPGQRGWALALRDGIGVRIEA